MTETESMKQIKKRVLQQRTAEQRLKNEIAAVTASKFAERAADTLNSRKHLYGFEVYLILLDNLKTLLYAGVPDNLALETVQYGFNVETVLSMWRLSKV